MTLIEAIKSGKPFTRFLAIDMWYRIEEDCICWGHKTAKIRSHGKYAILSADDICANDWRIKE